ncbi:hypothetical protein KSP39_PZI014538 [Platanthera zijinensis]|uniref:Transmembrane protein n=1 Tax=Platanthera zijinensis TaxID=2320716 RepID=A0AAP0B9G0_9ASPA
MISIRENDDEISSSSLAKQIFHGISITLLSLLLPLSFLLISRLATLLPTCKLISAILFFLVFSLSFAGLLCSIACHSPTFKAPKTVAWAILSLLQSCISWGIGAMGSTALGPDGRQGSGNVIWIKRMFFFVAIREIMMLWRGIFVKPVVDDTVYGEEREERGVDEVLAAVAFGVMWLWMLRMEMEPLMLYAGNESSGKETMGLNGFPLWLLSLTVAMTGILRVVDVLFRTKKALFQIRWLREKLDEASTEDKV